jgi:hypothetical protein
MIYINHDLKAIYVPIPETGTSFINNILKKYYGFKKYEIEPLSNEGPHHSVDNTPMYKKDSLTNNYLQMYVINNMDETEWKTYKKFTIIRCPYDRIVAAFRYCTDCIMKVSPPPSRQVTASRRHCAMMIELNRNWTNDKMSESLNLKEFLLRYKQKESYTNEYDWLCYIHSFMPQYKYILDINNEMIIDYIGRFENLNEDLCDILIKLGVNDILHGEELVTNNKVNELEPKRENYINYYDEPTLELVNQICEIDFANFNQYTIKQNIDELRKEDYYVDDTKLMSKNQDLLQKLNENKHINIVTTDSA